MSELGDDHLGEPRRSQRSFDPSEGSIPQRIAVGEPSLEKRPTPNAPDSSEPHEIEQFFPHSVADAKGQVVDRPRGPPLESTRQAGGTEKEPFGVLDLRADIPRPNREPLGQLDQGYFVDPTLEDSCGLQRCKEELQLELQRRLFRSNEQFFTLIGKACE